jgi:Ca-activated chloride channel family protein
MTFSSPWLLLGLLLLPAAVAAYRYLLRRRTERAKSLAAQGLVAASGPAGSGRARFAVPALFLAALTLLLVGLARPQATVAEPRREGTVVLAFDVSNSMTATDIAPTRLVAAQKAAHAFVDRQPSTVKIGVVAFSDTGLVTQQPTDNKADVLAAVDRLTAQGSTSLSHGIQSSLTAIAGKPVTINAPSEDGSPAPGNDIGYFSNAAVILLSDGEDTTTSDPLIAAQTAALAGVKVYPIGLGSPAGTTIKVDGYTLATTLDEPLLKQVASDTGGTYYAADDAASLTSIYSHIDLKWVAHPEFVEVTGLFAAAAALLILLGVGLSLYWVGRVI